MSYLHRLFLLCCFLPCFAAAKPTVLVSVAPYKHFVEQVAAGTVDVALMVPAGTSSHTFEPTPRQMLNASHADIWFQIGEGFEAKAGKALQSYHSDMIFVDLRRGIDLIYCREEERCHCSQHMADCNIDPHFWLSPKEVKKQVQVIAATLQKKYPEHRDLYQAKAELLQAKLDELDKEIAAELATAKGRVILVSHPAYGYFCRDYHCIQRSIELEGKDPTPRELTRILTEARENRINKVYIQMQYNSKGARLIAEELGAKVIVLDPYAENYFDSMREIARNFAK